MNKFRMIKKLSSLFILLVLAVQPVAADTTKIDGTKANIDREKRMASEVEDAVLDGDVIFLKDSVNEGHEFMAIDQEPDDETKGAVIILHGRGFHPNWEDTVFPLRTQLPSKGWRTLSLQMPVLVKTAKYFDYVPLFPQAGPRIEAGIQYLREQGVKKIIILSHSCGAHMAMEWVRSKEGKLDDDIVAYIGAGMGATDFGQKMKQPFPLDTMKIPVLDIFGSKEYPAVLAKAPGRLLQITKAANEKSRQIIVPGADHYFTDKGDELVAPVVEWLDSL